jgi:hypothetical protein
MNATESRRPAKVLTGLSWLALALCTTAVCASDADDIQAAGYLERITYYGMALADQREALAASSLEASRVLASYQTAVQEQDVAAASRLKAEQDAMVGLESLYTEKLQATIAALAGEHDVLATKWQARQMTGEAAKHILQAAALWTESGELCERTALLKQGNKDFEGAGAALEKAAAAYEAARSRLAQARRLSATREINDGIRDTRRKGLLALRNASVAYADAIDLHTQRAREEKLDIQKGNAGERWRLAAVAQQSRERVQLLIRTLEQSR